mmetsp:Transcript_103251/g.290525  ORF Transcript_103251/g.290525 Transcript_103251/m.290525 type:complete len:248 (+) Transcript_103251:84-827(+)
MGNNANHDDVPREHAVESCEELGHAILPSEQCEHRDADTGTPQPLRDAVFADDAAPLQRADVRELARGDTARCQRGNMGPASAILATHGPHQRVAFRPARTTLGPGEGGNRPFQDDPLQGEQQRDCGLQHFEGPAFLSRQQGGCHLHRLYGRHVDRRDGLHECDAPAMELHGRHCDTDAADDGAVRGLPRTPLFLGAEDALQHVQGNTLGAGPLRPLRLPRRPLHACLPEGEFRPVVRHQHGVAPEA